MKKFIVFCSVCSLLVGCSTGNSSNKSATPLRECLVVGLESGYPPFEYKDVHGEIVGLDVDLATSIAKRLGKTLVVQDMEFEGEILSLKQGKIDLIISGMNITPDRCREILMIPYHGEKAVSLSLIFWEKIPEGVVALEGLGKIPGAVVSVGSGTTAETYMGNYPNIEVRSFEGALAPLMDVAYGKSMANLVETDVANYLRSQHPQIKVIEVPLAEDDAILGFGIGVKKENQQLYVQVKEVVEDLKKNGDLKKLEEAWFGRDAE